MGYNIKKEVGFMYKNYIHVQVDNEVFRINKKYEKFLFFYMEKLKGLVYQITKEEFDKKNCKFK